MDAERAFRQTNLHRIIIKVEKRKSRLRTKAEAIGIDANFGPSIAVGPELVSSCHRTVYNRIDPFVRASWFEGDRASCEAQTCCAGGRIIIVRGGSDPWICQKRKCQ